MKYLQILLYLLNSKDHIELKSFTIQLNVLINGISSLWARIIPQEKVFCFA